MTNEANMKEFRQIVTYFAAVVTQRPAIEQTKNISVQEFCEIL